MRLGIFGGTFDPVHHGHLVVAADAYEALELDRLLLIPAGQPPHKAGPAALPQVRLEMLRVAVEGDDRFRVDDLEIRRDGPSYTVETLRHLKDRHPGAELVLLLGSDCLPDLESWREPVEIARLARLVVLSRGENEQEPSVDVPFERISVTRVDISATGIRRRIAADRPVRYLLPESVRAVIERERLYR